jgi:malate dehydrogenase (oxaloacetate-decarboxylating)(NADP+)
MMQAGRTQAQAKARCWFMDSRGLVVAGRAGLAAHKQPFAQAHAPIADLLAAVEAIRPTALIGASGAAGAFTEPVLAAMAANNRRPVIFALSNPTSKAECTAEQAYAATGGRAIFASGSPFAPVAVQGRSRATGQANNSFIFPGLGLGVLAAGATRVTDAMFLAAADTLAGQVSADDLDAGRVFPPAVKMREVAAAVATAVAQVAYDRGLATRPRPEDLGAAIRASRYRAEYAAAG